MYDSRYDPFSLIYQAKKNINVIASHLLVKFSVLTTDIQRILTSLDGISRNLSVFLMPIICMHPYLCTDIMN